MVPARVSTAIRQTVPRGVQITFNRDGNGETENVTCTPRHPIATERGYVSAEDLQPDDRLLLAEGTATLSKLELVTTAFEVIKLEVEAHHCFFVSALRLLVHNWCEGMAQPHLESELDNGHLEKCLCEIKVALLLYSGLMIFGLRSSLSV